MSEGNKRKNIAIGIEVEIVQKQDQRSGDLTEGVVKKDIDQITQPPTRYQGNVRNW